jgi:hypothetical protein
MTTITSPRYRADIVGSGSVPGGTTRLFNYWATGGQALGNFVSLQGRDLGALVAGYSDVEQSIADALTAGKRVKVTFLLQITYEKTNPVATSSTSLEIDFFTGTGAFVGRTQIFLSVDGLSTILLCGFQTELYQVADGEDVLYRQSATTLSCQEQITPPDAATEYISIQDTYTDPASNTPSMDGKIKVYSVIANNCTLETSSLLLKGLTIDIIN